MFNILNPERVTSKLQVVLMYTKFSKKEKYKSWYLFSRIDHKDVRDSLSFKLMWLEE